ncbi:MAG: hypothetical protein QM741_03490 [Rudaea sp.]|uniref:hypothetical protein n=1 Tax=Rudaea sp. TaxID=2136325 RepID=UPI0039E5A61B
MSEAAPDFYSRKQAALIALLGVSLVLGIVEAALLPALGEKMFALQVCGSAIMLLIGFYWLHIDSRHLGIRRPTWLNLGIVLIAIAFVPYYLYKTRAIGQCGKAIGAFFGLVIACAFLSTIGALLSMSLQGSGT